MSKMAFNTNHGTNFDDCLVTAIVSQLRPLRDCLSTQAPPHWKRHPQPPEWITRRPIIYDKNIFERTKETLLIIHERR